MQVFHAASPSTHLTRKVVSPRDNWYDHAMLLARTDYKPIHLDNPEDPFEARCSL